MRIDVRDLTRINSRPIDQSKPQREPIDLHQNKANEVLSRAKQAPEQPHTGA
ncbi:MAG: hypothetical protein WCK81_06915 [Betaproteobacteria bacterium]